MTEKVNRKQKEVIVDTGSPFTMILLDEAKTGMKKITDKQDSSTHQENATEFLHYFTVEIDNRVMEEKLNILITKREDVKPLVDTD